MLHGGARLFWKVEVIESLSEMGEMKKETRTYKHYIRQKPSRPQMSLKRAAVLKQWWPPPTQKLRKPHTNVMQLTLTHTAFGHHMHARNT